MNIPKSNSNLNGSDLHGVLSTLTMLFNDSIHRKDEENEQKKCTCYKDNQLFW